MIELLLGASLLVGCCATLAVTGQLWRIAEALQKWNHNLNLDAEEDFKDCGDEYCDECNPERN